MNGEKESAKILTVEKITKKLKSAKNNPRKRRKNSSKKIHKNPGKKYKNKFKNLKGTKKFQERIGNIQKNLENKNPGKNL